MPCWRCLSLLSISSHLHRCHTVYGRLGLGWFGCSRFSGQGQVGQWEFCACYSGLSYSLLHRSQAKGSPLFFSLIACCCRRRRASHCPLPAFGTKKHFNFAMALPSKPLLKERNRRTPSSLTRQNNNLCLLSLSIMPVLLCLLCDMPTMKT